MKILIVGLGSIGQRHLRNINALFPKYEILVHRKKYFTPFLNKKNEITKKNKLHKNLKIFTSYTNALNQKPNAVFICNPTSMHINYAIKAAQKSINIFIEKPLSNDLKKIDILQKLIIKNNIVFMIGFQFRFHPLIKYVKNILLKKKLGALIGANIYNGEYLPNFHKYEDYKESYASKKKLGGGVVLSVIHEIDLCVYFFGNPTNVYSIGGKFSDLKIDVEDYSNSIISFNNTEEKRVFPVSITLDYFQNPSTKTIKIVGSKATLIWDYNKSSVLINYHNGKNKNIIKKIKNFNRDSMFYEEIKCFIKCIKQKKQPSLNFDEAIKSLKIALSIKESMKKNKVIKIF